MSQRLNLKDLNIVSYYLILLLLVQLGFFVWAIDKGFDFTDEAFSFIGFRYPEELTRAATFYTVIFDKAFGWFGVSIIQVRIIRLLFLLASSAYLSLGLIRWLKITASEYQIHYANLLLFIAAGSLLLNANGSQAFTYNLASVILFHLIIGTFFFSLQRGKEIARSTILLFFFQGGLLFTLFAVKFSNAVLVAPALIFLHLIDSRSVKRVAHYCLVLAIGAILFGFFWFGNLYSWLHEYRNTLSVLGKSTGSSIWSRYIEDYHYTKDSKIVSNLTFILPCIVLTVVSWRVPNKVVKIVAGSVAACLTAYVAYNGDYYLAGVKHYYTFTGLYIILLFILLSSLTSIAVFQLVKKRDVNFPVLISIGLLLVVPLFGVIGTNNLLSIQMIWYSSFVFGTLYLLLSVHDRILTSLMIVVVSTNAAIQSVGGLVYAPYRINETLLQETQQLPDSVSEENTRVNAAIRESVEKAHHLIYSKTKFSKGDYIFSFSPDYFGFIYLLDARLPGWSWYDEKGSEGNRLALQATDPSIWQKTIFLVPPRFEMDSVYKSSFQQLNVRFPDDFTELGEVPYSIEHNDRLMKIFAPTTFLKKEN